MKEITSFELDGKIYSKGVDSDLNGFVVEFFFEKNLKTKIIKEIDRKTFFVQHSHFRQKKCSPCAK